MTLGWSPLLSITRSAVEWLELLNDSVTPLVAPMENLFKWDTESYQYEMVPSLPSVTPTKPPSGFVTRTKTFPESSMPTSALEMLVPNTPTCDTESYPADSTASPKRRCAARKTSTERAT